jgi:TonB-dependent receptor
MSQSEANRNQPDMRDTIYATPVGGLLSIQPNLIEGQLSRSNFYSKTRDVSRFLGGDVEIPFTQWSGLEAKLKLGFTAMERTRSFDAERFFFRQNTSTNTNLLGGQLTPSLYPFTPEAILNPLNRGTQGYYVDESTRPTDTYAARQKLYSKYLQIDTPVVSKLRFIGGVRYENNFQVVTTKNPFDLAATFFDAYNYRGYLNQNQLNWIDPTYRKTTAINQNKNYLPSANFVYALSDNTNIRTAYTETISRPDFREMSAFEFTPILGGAPEKGNPFLKRAYIHNYDVRYEYYPRSEEVIAIGVFKKQISSPIEKVMEIDSQFRYTYTNAKSAQIQGVEFELRKNLDIVSQVLRKWTFGVNTFFIKSEVSFNDWWFYLLNVSTQRPTSLSRPLQGQSPYVYNVNLRYKFDEKGDHSITILFNQFGKRINAVGGLGIPDTYERPVGMLDAVYSFKYFEKLDFKFALRNITDTRIKIVQEDPWRQKETTINSYRLGPTITFSVTYNL